MTPNLDKDTESQPATDLSVLVPAQEILPLLTEARSGYALFTTDPTGRLVTWTPGASSVFGWSSQEAIGANFEQMFTPEDRAAGVPGQELAMAAAEGFAPDVRWHLKKGGGRVFIHGVTQRLLDDSGRLAGFLKAGRDLTAQYEAEAALQRTEQRHRVILENVQDYALYLLDPEGKVNGWNAGSQRLTGYAEPDIMGRHFGLLYLPCDRDAGRPEADLDRARAEGRAESEGWRLGKDGSQLWVHEILTAVSDPLGGLEGFVAIARDITQHRLTQRELLEQERETGQLAERTRMAQELHDTLAQGFTGIRLQIELAEESLRESPPQVEVALRHLGRALEFSKACQQDSRRSIRALRSPLFEDLSLNDALEQLVQQVKDSIVPVSLHTAGPPITQPPELQKDVYRIAQEALTNALRHSGAKHIVLWLEQAGGRARLLVSDDGCGFATDPDGPGGFGLLGMRERAQRLGAELAIASPPEGGTRVSLTWDIPSGNVG